MFVEQIQKNRNLIMGFLVVALVVYWLKQSGKIEFMLSPASYPWNNTDATQKATPMPSPMSSGCNMSNMSASVGLIPEVNDVVRDKAFEFAPKKIDGINFMIDAPRTGQDTQGSSNKNASYDIRRTPANAKVEYPWMNSTIEPDLFRRPLE